MNKILFNSLEIIHITKPHLKHSYISVSKTSEVVLKTPKISKPFRDKLLKEKESWIKKQLANVKQNQPKKIDKDKEIYLFGEIVQLDAIDLKYFENFFKIKDYDGFYKQYGKIYLRERLDYFSNLMGLEFRDLKIKKLKSRWGSCNSKKEITLNSNLLKIDKKFIDYVVVHELAHLKYMNHSKDFHNLVKIYLEDSDILRKKLKRVILES